ncbi:SgcJ/EcaC family oxidoreductase [Actinoplanes aureus]|uniref:SgcJ/EcaC family oxidoreductase n=1 Tax=Actinoplanes aureus TaxID=2792083 RepID=A0A931C3Y8_9ACTN|nr:SgcJ/EcaC family oxidoreductase [Actinoplanes aureus]MBG0560137.1 SgcJ/EcaC family oxidoreductase [Actinoplanes aureus]
MTGTAVESAARELYRRLLTAWNERDADGFARLFAEDGAMVGFDGSQVPGGRAAEHLGPIFADHPTAAYVARVEEVRPVGAEAVLLRAIAGMIPPGRTELSPERNTIQTVVAEKQPDGWRILLFQNTPAQYHGRPEETERHTAALRPLADDGVIVA